MHTYDVQSRPRAHAESEAQAAPPPQSASVSSPFLRCRRMLRQRTRRWRRRPTRSQIHNARLVEDAGIARPSSTGPLAGIVTVFKGLNSMVASPATCGDVAMHPVTHPAQDFAKAFTLSIYFVQLRRFPGNKSPHRTTLACTYCLNHRCSSNPLSACNRLVPFPVFRLSRILRGMSSNRLQTNTSRLLRLGWRLNAISFLHKSAIDSLSIKRHSKQKSYQGMP